MGRSGIFFIPRDADGCPPVAAPTGPRHDEADTIVTSASSRHQLGLSNF